MSNEVQEVVAASGGVLRLDAALVARDWLPPGYRLGLPDDAYDAGERGFICERWLGSTTTADNRVGPDDEGISYIRSADGSRLSLAAAVQRAPQLILGSEYASTHAGLGRLAKIFDFGARLPFHIHPPTDQAALVGRSSKDEVYYFPSDVDMGAHPETFFGLHPWIAANKREDVLLPHLQAWCDDAILRHSFAYQQVAEQGFYIDSGILHAPGTALTVELQEDSDTLSMFQALNAGQIISKDLLYKDVSTEDRDTLGERALMRWVDWEANGDPQFYENRLVAPQRITAGPGVVEDWILYGTSKFSGKRLRLAPGARVSTSERGVYNLLAWRGRGTVGGQPVVGGVPGEDELLVVHGAAVKPHEVVNTGEVELELLKFFGPDINPDAPRAGLEL